MIFSYGILNTKKKEKIKKVIFITNYLMRIKEKHREKIYANKKEPLEILQYIQEKFNLREINKKSIDYLHEIKITKINGINAEANYIKIEYDNLNILVYEIMPDELSMDYYESHHQNVRIHTHIYIMLETNTGCYLYSYIYWMKEKAKFSKYTLPSLVKLDQGFFLIPHFSL